MIPWLAGAAAAAVPTHDEWRELVVRLIPAVEASAGRRWSGPVVTAVLDRDTLARTLALPAPSLGEGPVTRAIGPEPGLDHMLAAYLPETQRVVLVAEAVEELIRTDGLDSDEVSAVLTCAAVHEIVHGLQDQYGAHPGDGDDDVARGYAAVREGHASLVELEVCGERVGAANASLAEAVGGMSAPGTVPPDDPVAPYALGRALVAEVRRRDPELVWKLFVAPPPSWSALVADVRPALAGGWADPEPLRAALAAFEPGEADPRFTAVGPYALRSLVGGAPPRARVGWAARRRSGSEAIVALLLDEGVPAELLARRRAELAQDRFGVMLDALSVPGAVKVGRRPRLERDGRASLRAWFVAPGLPRGVELWVAAPRVLVVVERASLAGTSAADLEAFVDRLVTDLDALDVPSEQVPLAALAGWYADLVAAPPAEELPSPDWRMMRAAIQWSRGEAAACATVFADALAPGRPAWTSAAHECAARTGDLALADHAAGLLAEVDAAAAMVHVNLLVQADRAREGIALLDRAGPVSAELAPHFAAVRMYALAADGRWDALAAAAREPVAPPEVRVAAAQTLLSVGRRADARAILAAACAAADAGGSRPEGCPAP